MINITYANFHNNENKIQNNTSSLDILRYPNDKIGRVTNMKVYN
ncbi:pyridoxal phosphate-dependent aminotransferase, partial [Escherichia coli]|nr:pyridoxal phosphate-dependent aminotransferase [Escherichia coli]